jgi:hypothetical protein
MTRQTARPEFQAEIDASPSVALGDLKVASGHLEVVLSHRKVVLRHLEFDSDCRHSIRVSTYGVNS